MSLCKKLISAGSLAIRSQLEYRFNFFMDAVFQPSVTAIIEVSLWWAIFGVSGLSSMNNFSSAHYLAYALWASFFARITANWMYEFRMMEEIASGSVNSILVRPIGFYEFYLGQFMGYKIFCAFTSLVIPIAIFSFISSPSDLSRVPLAALLSFYYLIFVFTLSFCVASLAFYFTRVHSFTVAKNLLIWLFSGELFPLDLVPESIRKIMIALPFASGCYIPVGYITQRFGAELVWQSFISVSIGIVITSGIAVLVWNHGRKIYSGTGA